MYKLTDTFVLTAYKMFFVVLDRRLIYNFK